MSVARSSPSTVSHSPRVRAWVPSRLGVASRLLLAFLGISGVAVVGCGRRNLLLSRYWRRSRSHHGEPGTRSTGLAGSVTTSRTDCFGRTGLALCCDASRSHRDFPENWRRNAGTCRAVGQPRESRRRRRCTRTQCDRQSAVSGLNFESLDKLVADRMLVSELKRGSSEQRAHYP